MIDYSAFTDEYLSIQKEAALSTLLQGGAKAIKGTFNAARKGWAGKGLSGGETGFKGVAEAGKGYWNALGNTAGGQTKQLGAKAIGLAGTAGAAGLGAGYIGGRLNS